MVAFTINTLGRDGAVVRRPFMGTATVYAAFGVDTH